MKRILFTLFFIIPLLLQAQKTILWKVTQPGSTHVSYLLGTQHLLNKEYVDSYPVIAASLKQTDVVYSEVNKDSARIQSLYNLRPSSYQLKEVVSASDLELINKILLFSTAKDWTKFTPGELISKISGYYEAYANGAQPGDIRIDDYIQIMAKRFNKQSIYFESDSFQIEMLRKATDPLDWKYFKKNIGQWLDKYRQPAPDFTTSSIYKQFHHFDLDYAFDAKCNGEAILQGRNEAWMKVILPVIKEKNCFIAVGLTHLGKECGLIQQLRNAGYVVEPVEMQG